jgi:competence protein ComFB
MDMLVNLMEKEVPYVVNKVLNEMDDVCKCDKCKLDIIAIALNNLKSHYVVSEKGEVFSKINNMSYQFNSDVVVAVTKAIEIVKKNPKHDL